MTSGEFCWLRFRVSFLTVVRFMLLFERLESSSLVPDTVRLSGYWNEVSEALTRLTILFFGVLFVSILWRKRV